MSWLPPANTMVESETAIDLKFRRDTHYASAHSRRLLVTRPLLQRKPCWSVQEKTDMIDTAARGWVCPPIYMIPRPEECASCIEGEDHVFDGAHKLEAIFEFMDGKFKLHYSDLTTAFLGAHQGLTFAELPRDIQERIRKYKFQINIVDSETAGDLDMLRVLWERVNRAGKRLNEYELSIPVIAPLVEKVLDPCKALFVKSLVFPKEESRRGDLEQKIQIMLAVAEISDLRTGFNSLTGLIKHWHKSALGDTMESRATLVEKNAERWRGVLERCAKMMRDLEQLNCFCDENGASIMEEAHRTDLLLLLARLARQFPRIEDFRSQKVALSARFKTEIFLKGPFALMTELGARSRNWSFQKKMIEKMDGLVGIAVAALQPRLFTKAQKREKLKQQGGRCVACSEKILSHQLADGDHVLEWSVGGETTLENCQILHRHCHQEKGKKTA